VTEKNATERSVESLPAYRVTRSGFDERQAKRLAEAFRVRASKVVLRDGVVSYIDPQRYLKVPLTEVTDPNDAEKLRAMSAAARPNTRLRLQRIDFDALNQLSSLDHDTALKKTGEALDLAGLSFAHASRVAGDTNMTVTFVDGSPAGKAMTRPLQTWVRHDFSDGHGHALIGPGAQAHVTYDGAGEVTHLHFATRQVEEGPIVRIFSRDEARSRVAHKFSRDAEINLWLVYWCPSLRRAPGRDRPLAPEHIVPCYAYNSVVSVADPRRGGPSERRSKIELMPATDDRRFVPAVNLRLFGRARVEAVAEVQGGHEPYSYVWSGSNPEVSGQLNRTISYVPLSRGALPGNPASPARVERRETVGVTVIDANGVMTQQSGLINVIAHLVPKGKGGGPFASYGTESPREPEFAVDRQGWQTGMATPGGGTRVFAWLGDTAWPGDFIEPNPPDALVPTPWINGDADYSNWGVNTAAIVLNNTDGWATGFCSSEPGATDAEYPTAELNCPSSSGGTVVTNLLNGSATATTQYSNISEAGAWGPVGPNGQLLWLVMDACDTLDATSSSGTPQDRWGAAFGGLHILFGFNSEEQVGDGSFEQDFAENMLAGDTMLLQAWFAAGAAAGLGGPPNHGVPAALGPNAWDGSCDINDYYLGKGTQGPTILPASIGSWWYVSD
jgi:hypothetical protein